MYVVGGEFELKMCFGVGYDVFVVYVLLVCVGEFVQL